MAKAEQSHPRPPMPMVCCDTCGWFANADLAASLLRGRADRLCPSCGSGRLEDVTSHRFLSLGLVDLLLLALALVAGGVLVVAAASVVVGGGR